MPTFPPRPPRSRCRPAPLAVTALLALTGCLALSACDEGVSSDPEIPVEITVRLGDGSATSLTFPEVALGAPSPVQIATVVNRGHIRTPRLALELIGDGAASFRISGGDCQDAELAPGATCAIELTAVPTAFGAVDATLRVRATARVAVAVALRGSGRGTVFQISLDANRWPSPTLPPLEVGVETRIPIYMSYSGHQPQPSFSLTASSSGADVRVERASDQPGCTRSDERTCGDELVVRPTALGTFTITVEARAEGELARAVVESAGAGRITVTATGEGSVEVLPHVLCVEPCSFLATAAVTLAANPRRGSELVGWTSSDQQCVTGAPIGAPPSPYCRVVPSLTPIEVGVAFAIDMTRTLTLQVTGDPNAYVTAARDDVRIPWCGCQAAYSPCTCTFEIGERISLRAYSLSGFGGWSAGPCPREDHQCTITIAKDVEAAASFAKDDATWTRKLQARALPTLVALVPEGGVAWVASQGYGVARQGPDGADRWNRTIAGQEAMGLGVAANGDTYVLSSVFLGSRGHALYVQRYDDKGTPGWRREIVDALPTDAATPRLLAVSPTGDIIIAVEIATSAGNRTLVRAYDAAGDIAWSDVSDAGPPVAVAVTAKGVTHVLAGMPGHRVLRSLATDGAVLPALPPPVLAPSDDFQGLAIDAEAHLVLASRHGIDAITETGSSAFHIDVAASDDDQVMVAAGPAIVRVDANRASPSTYRIATYDLRGAPVSETSGHGQSSDVVAGGDDLWLSDVAVAADGAVAVTGLWHGDYDFATVRLYAP